ncbi:MAG: outer membrane beta-barrel protein [Bacteroidales bacterium]
MKKILLVAALIAAFTTGAYAQTENGFGGQVEVGYGLKMNDKLNVFQVSLMPGYHFGPYLFAGVGVGFNSYSANGESISTFPIFAHGTVNFTSGTTWTPFLAAKVGYGIGKRTESLDGANYELKSGFYFAPSLGMKYKVSPQYAVSLALFYDAMGFKETVTELGELPASATTTNSAIGLRLGFEF